MSNPMLRHDYWMARAEGSEDRQAIYADALQEFADDVRAGLIRVHSYPIFCEYPSRGQPAYMRVEFTRVDTLRSGLVD